MRLAAGVPVGSLEGAKGFREASHVVRDWRLSTLPICIFHPQL